MCGLEKRWKHLSVKPFPRLDFAGIIPSKGSLETITLIGHRCKHSNMLSQVILIVREAFTLFPRFCSSYEQLGFTVLLCTCLYKFVFVFWLIPYCSIFNISASIDSGSHPFPSRTRKLRHWSLMVLGLRTWETKLLPDLWASLPKSREALLFLNENFKKIMTLF